MKNVEIVGISAGRKGKTTDQAVKTVLDASGCSHTFISLSAIDLLTCDACNGCVKSHKCIKNDGLNGIIDLMIGAKAIVFGAPEYWDGMNAKGRAFWERVCFINRHNAQLPLTEKYGVAIGVGGDGRAEHTIADIERFFKDSRMNVIDALEVRGSYACYTCGFGGECTVGGLAELYSLPVKVNREMIPTIDNQYPETEENQEKITLKLINIGQKIYKKI